MNFCQLIIIALVVPSCSCLSNVTSNKFVVVDGDNWIPARSELIEMQDEYPSQNFSGCIMAKMPRDSEFRLISSGVTAFIFNRLVFCGGRDSDLRPFHIGFGFAICKMFNWVNNEWEFMSGMTQTRFDAAGAVVTSAGMNDEFWFITGGMNRQEYPTDTMEMMNRGFHFRSGHEMPGPKYRHCLVAINNTHLVALGGAIYLRTKVEPKYYEDHFLDRTVYFYDVEQDSWTNGTSLLPEFPKKSTCALLDTESATKEILLYTMTQEKGFTHIYNAEANHWRRVETATLEWRRKTSKHTGGRLATEYQKIIQLGPSSIYLSTMGINGDYWDKGIEFHKYMNSKWTPIKLIHGIKPWGPGATGVRYSMVQVHNRFTCAHVQQVKKRKGEEWKEKE